MAAVACAARAYVPVKRLRPILHVLRTHPGRYPPHAALVNERKYATQGAEVTWYNDAQCEKLILQHAGREALARYRAWPSGANRADLWRYLALYVYGGVYLDADVLMAVPITAAVPDLQSGLCYSAVAASGRGLFQAVLACPPRSPFMLQLFIDLLTATPWPAAWQTKATLRAYRVLEQAGVRMDAPGVDAQRKFVLWKERCVHHTGYKYGKRCVVHNSRNQTLFLSRGPLGA